MQKLSKLPALFRAPLVYLLTILSAVDVALAADTCKGIYVPSEHFIYLADEKFGEIPGTAISLGNITLPLDEKSQAALKKKYFVISSRNLTHDVLPTAGGRDMAYLVDPERHPCKRVNISSVTFDFDSSILAPGDFHIETPFIGSKGNGRATMSAKVSQVTGHIRRVWFQASIQSTEKYYFEIKLINAGNLATTSLNFDEAPDYWPIKLVSNECQGKKLQPTESCAIKLVRRKDTIDSNTDERWHFSFDGEKAHSNLELDFKGLKVYASIPRFINK